MPERAENTCTKYSDRARDGLAMFLVIISKSREMPPLATMVAQLLLDVSAANASTPAMLVAQSVSPP